MKRNYVLDVLGTILYGTHPGFQMFTVKFGK